MTYRNDHDAALARIDALESELARARADDGANAARAELDRLEDEIKRRRGERDRLEREIEHARPDRKRYQGAKLAIAMVALAGMIGVRALLGSARRTETVSPSQPVHTPPPSPPAPLPSASVATHVVECARELDRAIAEHTTSSQICIEQIRVASTDPVLGVDVHNLLTRWLAAEDPRSLEQRDALAPEIHRVIIPSFTR